MGSLNFASQAVPLGRLWCRRLWWEGNRCFSPSRPLVLRPIPVHVRSLLRWWLHPGVLDSSVPWCRPAPHLDVYTDASDIGWGYQASSGLQGSGLWTHWDLEMHVNERELLVPLLFLRGHPHLRDLHICFHLDSMVAVHCISMMGSSRAIRLQTLSEKIFHLASPKKVLLSAVHVPGVENVWADALS